MTIVDRILQIANTEGVTITYIENKIGASKGVLSRALNKGTDIQSKWVTKIVENYQHYNAEWLLTGKGKMTRNTPAHGFSYTEKMESKPCIINEELTKYNTIPLVEQEAIGGFGGDNFCINTSDIVDTYVIPELNEASFFVRVRGNSMFPRYASGDTVACKILHESQFIQWNEIHVIATKEQGILIKRIQKGTSENTLVAISENPEFPPFEVPKDEITGIALVLGGVRLE